MVSGRLAGAAVVALLGGALMPVAAHGASPQPPGSACRRTAGVVARTDGWSSIRAPSDLTVLEGFTVAPANARVLFAYDATHLDRSADGGCSWSTVFTVPAGLDLGQGERAQHLTEVEASGSGVWVVTSSAQ